MTTTYNLCVQTFELPGPFAGVHFQVTVHSASQWVQLAGSGYRLPAQGPGQIGVSLVVVAGPSSVGQTLCIAQVWANDTDVHLALVPGTAGTHLTPGNYTLGLVLAPGMLITTDANDVFALTMMEMDQAQQATPPAPPAAGM